MWEKLKILWNKITGKKVGPSDPRSLYDMIMNPGDNYDKYYIQKSLISIYGQ